MTPTRARTPVPILAYHSIGDRPTDQTMRWSVSPGDFDLALARVLVERDTGAEGIALLLDGHGVPLSWPGQRPRTRGWRAYRRGRHLVDHRVRRLTRPTSTAGRTR